MSKYPFGDDYEITGTTTTKYIDAGFGVFAKKVTTGGSTTTYWLHSDRMGSINATTDAAAVEVLRRSYRVYGELLAQTGANTESRGYIEQRTDSETGLTYLHARYYDSSLGMFVSPDPSDPLEGGVGLNRFSYVMGDPVNGLDRSGLSCRTTLPGGTVVVTTECVTVEADYPDDGLNGSWSSSFWNYFFLGSSPSPPRRQREHPVPCSQDQSQARCTTSSSDPPVDPPVPPPDQPKPPGTPPGSPQGPGAAPSQTPGSGNEACRKTVC